MPDDIGRRIGVQLRKVRWARGLTQQDVAAPLSITPQQVQKYERGEGLSAAQLVRIAGVLGVSPASLLQCDETALWGRETIEVAVAYMRLPARTRATVRDLLRQLAEPAAEVEAG